MSATRIENLLRQMSGLDVSASGRTAITNAVRRRMAQCRLDSDSEYWEYLQTSNEELQELIEEVVVPETWFFRDKETFLELTRMVVDEWLPAHPAGTLRLLSLPCSTGEEPYSIAMALLDTGLDPERFVVDGVDISRRALNTATRAVYGGNSFRGRDLDFRERYFRRAVDGFHLVPSVRHKVRFHPGNLLDPNLNLRIGSYDFVFCRNALIYFDRDSQEQAIDVLRQLLLPQGVLFVGHAEAFAVAAGGFHTTGCRSVASFRKGVRCQKFTLEACRKSANRIIKVPIKSNRPATPKLQPRLQHAEPPPDAVAEACSGLEAAARLADLGQLDKAAEICTAQLGVQGSSAAAYFLLGLVRDAQGDSERAAECYRKTIYLDPSHAEALMHLAFLAEKQGDFAAAQRLRDRARRLEHSATR